MPSFVPLAHGLMSAICAQCRWSPKEEVGDMGGEVGIIIWARRGKPQLWWPTFSGLPPWGGRRGGPELPEVSPHRAGRGPLQVGSLSKWKCPPLSSQGFVWGHEGVWGLERPETQGLAAEQSSEGTDFFFFF